MDPPLALIMAVPRFPAALVRPGASSDSRFANDERGGRLTEAVPSGCPASSFTTIVTVLAVSAGLVRTTVVIEFELSKTSHEFLNPSEVKGTIAS